MKDTAYLHLIVTPELFDAVTDKAHADRLGRAEWVRKALAKAVGKPALATLPRGQGEHRNGKKSSH